MSGIHASVAPPERARRKHCFYQSSYLSDGRTVRMEARTMQYRAADIGSMSCEGRLR